MSEVSMNMQVDVNMPMPVALKSNKRRINFLTTKIAELTSELQTLESQEEAYEAQRSSKVTKRTKGRPQAKKDQVEEVDLFANLVKEVVSTEGAFKCAVECASSSSDNNDGSANEIVENVFETCDCF